MRYLRPLLAVALLAMAAPASATVITLDFEGVGDLNDVGNFYNGGAGTNYGVPFYPNSLAVVDADAGGSGNFANEPSPDTILFFLDSSKAILNYAAGFQNGFSFWYSSFTGGLVTVYDDVDGASGTGNILATLPLAAQYADNCVGDPNGAFCNWTLVGASFAGIAKSVDFGGGFNQTAYDNITFGSAGDVDGAPEPSTLALLGAGLAGVIRRRLQA